MHNVRVVNGRFSSRYVVRGFGFCHLNSPDIFRIASIIPRAIVIKLVLIGFISRTLQNTNANLPIRVATDLCQRLVELTLVLPVNVFRTFLLISNLHRVQCEVWDDWKKRATADDRNDHDYAECNKPESSRYCLHSDRCFDSVACNYQA